MSISHLIIWVSLVIMVEIKLKWISIYLNLVLVGIVQPRTPRLTFLYQNVDFS